VKTELMPDFDFDAFNHEDAPSSGDGDGGGSDDVQVVNAPVAETSAPVETVVETPAASTGDNGATEEVDKW